MKYHYLTMSSISEIASDSPFGFPEIRDPTTNQLLVKQTYSGGLMRKEWWYKNGVQMSIRNYCNDFKTEGKQFGWYSNGKPKYEQTYINGKYQGVQCFYHENGVKSIEEHYQDDVVLKRINYNERGEQTEIAHYKNGKIDRIEHMSK